MGAIRFNNYVRTGKHFYFLDFCYVSSAAIWLFIVVFPKNAFLYHVCLNLAFGVLAMSFYVFGDTIDLGHMDRHIPTIVHLVPALVMYNVHCVTTLNQKDLPAADEHRFVNIQLADMTSTDGIVQNLTMPYLFYIWWPLFNYIVVFKLYWSEIKEKKYLIQFVNQTRKGAAFHQV